MMHITTLKQAEAITGSLGKPSKMPGMSYGLPASNAGFVPAICKQRGLPVPLQYGCRVGSVLARIPGTPCYGCYADERGNYTYPSVQIAQTVRLVGLYHPQWVEAMVFHMNARFDKMFKEALTERLDDFWQEYDHMPNATEWDDLHTMAQHDTSYMRWHDSGDLLDVWHLHMLYDVAEATPYLKHWLPTQDSQIVARSNRATPSNMIIRHSSQFVDGKFKKRWQHVSGVTTKHDETCHALRNNNECGDCRKCWDADVYSVTYPLH
jgi:hypothetical protein